MKDKIGYIPKEERKKILFICDDIRAHSGCSTVAREIITHTAHHFSFVNLAGSIQHPDKGKKLDISQDINNLTGLTDASVFLIPTDGYGDTTLLRHIIEFEKPDAILLLTDPRYFTWLFNIENEIRKKIPICYLNIWDALPYPLWNKPFYESCDLLMAISKQTYNINRVVLGGVPFREIGNVLGQPNEDPKSQRSSQILLSYVPHGLDPNNYFPIDKTYSKFKEFTQFKNQLLKGKEYDFVLFFNSRNIRRKQIPDLVMAWRMFLDQLPKEKADKCCLLLHTEIVSEHGTDLNAVKDYFLEDYPDSIVFHTQGLGVEQMNWLYNSSDAQVLITDNEGFGLSLLEARLAGLPIIANTQGGMVDQMRFEDEKGNWINYDLDFPSNHRGTYKKHGEWAFPVYPSNISIQGSPMTPYIYSERCKPEDVTEQIKIVYDLGNEERKRRGLKGREWTMSEECGMTSKHQAERVIEAFDELFKTWKSREKFELINATEHKPDVTRKHKLIY